MFEGRPILCYDVETDSLDVNKAKIKWFGAYSYLHNEYYLLKYVDNIKEIKKLFQDHKILVGFNNKEYDNPIIQNNLNDDNIFDYKVIIDLLEISASKGGKDYGQFRKNRLAQMGIKLKNFTLKNIIEILKLDTEGTKGDINYTIFQKDEWTVEEIIEIKKYLKQDIDLTKKLFEWYEGQFAPLKKFLPQKDQDNFLYIKSSLSVLAYNIICNKVGLKPEFGEKTEGVHVKSFAGGHHIENRWELVRGNIIEIDIVSAYPHAIMMGNLHSLVGPDEEGWSGDGYYQIEGKYNTKEQGKIELALKDIFLERLKAKKAGDKAKNLSYKIIINCFAEDTDVMTVNGIRKLKDCKVGDLVYSINPKTEEVEIKPIEKMYEQEYHGDMIHFEDKNKDLLVTPEHKMLFKAPRTHKKTYSEIQRIEAKNIINRSGKYPEIKPISGLKDEFIDMKQFREKDDLHLIKLDNPYEDRRIDRGLIYSQNRALHYSETYNPLLKGKWFFQRRKRDMIIPEYIQTKDLFYLIGIFLSEGNIRIQTSKKYNNGNFRGTTYNVCISQYKNKNPEAYDKIKKCLDDIGIRYSISNKRFEISSQFWYDFFIKLKKNSSDINLPDWCWKYDSSLLKYLHEGLYDGDGNKKQYVYSTISKSLKNNIIRLNFHLGYRTTTSEENYVTKVNGLNGKIWRIRRTYDGFYKKEHNKIIQNSTNKVICCSVKDNHTIYAGRNDRFCHTGQSVYGLFGNPVFQTLYSRKTASDCTSIVRTWLKKLARILEINGFIPLYGFTDSIFVLVPPNFKKEQLMFLIDIFIKEAVTHVPFAMDTFNLGIEEEIKMIWFVAKNCYLFVTSTDEIKYKSTLLNTNTPKAVMKLFEEYMRPIIIEKLDIPFTKKELIEQMKIILEKEPELAAQEYKVGELSDYKVQTSLHYQISKKYGVGRHFLIPNKQNLGVGLGKSTKKKIGIRHCTIEEFKNKKFTVNDIDLTHLLSHLKPFYERNEKDIKDKYIQKSLFEEEK